MIGWILLWLFLAAASWAFVRGATQRPSVVLDTPPSPLTPAAAPPRSNRWAGPFYAGVLTAAVGFGSVVVFGLTSARLIFGLAGLAVAEFGWSRRT